MSTAADVIRLALGDIGAIDRNDEIPADLMIDSLATLNSLFASWNATPNQCIGQLKIDHSIVALASSPITIGPSGATITAANPTTIDHAYIRSGNYDTTLRIIATFSEYNEIYNKAEQGESTALYFNQKHPSSEIFLYPLPSTGTLTLVVPLAFPVYGAAADAIYIPASYELAVRFSLAEIMGLSLGIKVEQRIILMASNLRRTLSRNTAQIPELKTFGSGLSRMNRFLNGGA